MSFLRKSGKNWKREDWVGVDRIGEVEEGLRGKRLGIGWGGLVGEVEFF